MLILILYGKRYSWLINQSFIGLCISKVKSLFNMIPLTAIYIDEGITLVSCSTEILLSIYHSKLSYNDKRLMVISNSQFQRMTSVFNSSKIRFCYSHLIISRCSVSKNTNRPSYLLQNMKQFKPGKPTV